MLRVVWPCGLNGYPYSTSGGNTGESLQSQAIRIPVFLPQVVNVEPPKLPAKEQGKDDNEDNEEAEETGTGGGVLGENTEVGSSAPDPCGSGLFRFSECGGVSIRGGFAKTIVSSPIVSSPSSSTDIGSFVVAVARTIPTSCTLVLFSPRAP